MDDEQRRDAKKQMMELMQAGQSWQEAAHHAGIQTSRSTAYRWWQEGAGGLLLAAAAHETGLLSCLTEALPATPASTHPSGWFPQARSCMPLLLTLVLLGAVGLHRTRDLRGYTGDALGLLTGRQRAYSYSHLEERVLTTIAKAGGADPVTDALGKWTAALWLSSSPVSAPCFYIDGHRKVEQWGNKCG